MMRHAFADDGSRLHIRFRRHCGDEGSKQGGGTVAFVVVRAPLHLSRAHRQQRLSAIKSLNLALLVDTDDQRLVRWAEV